MESGPGWEDRGTSLSPESAPGTGHQLVIGTFDQLVIRRGVNRLTFQCTGPLDQPSDVLGLSPCLLATELLGVNFIHAKRRTQRVNNGSNV